MLVILLALSSALDDAMYETQFMEQNLLQAGLRAENVTPGVVMSGDNSTNQAVNLSFTQKTLLETYSKKAIELLAPEITNFLSENRLDWLIPVLLDNSILAYADMEAADLPALGGKITGNGVKPVSVVTGGKIRPPGYYLVIVAGDTNRLAKMMHNATNMTREEVEKKGVSRANVFAATKLLKESLREEKLPGMADAEKALDDVKNIALSQHGKLSEKELLALAGGYEKVTNMLGNVFKSSGLDDLVKQADRKQELRSANSRSKNMRNDVSARVAAAKLQQQQSANVKSANVTAEATPRKVRHSIR